MLRAGRVRGALEQLAAHEADAHEERAARFDELTPRERCAENVPVGGHGYVPFAMRVAACCTASTMAE